MKPWTRSKTLKFNALVLALAAAESQLHLIQPLLPVNFYAAVAFALPVINAALRVITTQALAFGSKP
jgi:hypothetical protein